MTSSLSRRSLAFASFAVFLGLAASSNLAQTTATQTVDFVAVTADGSPVENLTPGQITIKIDGKERAVHRAVPKALAGPPML